MRPAVSASQPAEDLTGTGKYRLDFDTGRVHTTETKTGNLGDPFLGGQVELRAILKNEVDGKETIAVRFLRPGGLTWEDTTIDQVVQFGSNVREIMQSKGMLVHHPEFFRAYMREQQDTLYRREKRVEVLYESFGLKRDGFLYAGKLYTEDGLRDVWVSTEVELRSKAMRPPEGASLEEWTRLIAMFFQSGMETHVLTILACAAGPLMIYMSSTEGGGMFHAWSPESAKGKTTSMTGGQSIYGQKSLDIMERDTLASRYAAMAVMGGMTITFNELPVDEGSGDLVKAFDANEDKTRMDPTGTHIKRPKGHWNTMFVSNANKSLFDYLQSDPNTTAQAWRVMEFRATLAAEVKLWDGDRMREELYKHAGTAGDALLRHIYCTKGKEAEVKQRLKACFRTLGERTRWPHQARYWLRMLAAMTVAGEIMHELKLIPQAPHAYIDWAILSLEDKTHQLALTTQLANAAEHLVTMLNEWNANTLVVKSGGMMNGSALYPVSEPRGSLLVRHELDTGLAYVPVKAFQKWAVQNANSYRETRLALMEQKIIAREVGCDLGHGTAYSTGAVPCIVINLKHPAIAMAAQHENARTTQSDDPHGTGTSLLRFRVH